jgi:membrane-bound serine protease (ClpP class)
MGINLKAFLLILDEIFIAGIIIFVLLKMGIQIPFWVYIIIAAACAALYWFLRRLLLDQRRKSPVGHEAMVGLTGECIRELNPGGLIRVNGEIWKAVSNCGLVTKGAEVTIENLQGLTLTVRTRSEEY